MVRNLKRRTGALPQARDAFGWSDIILSAMKAKTPQFIEQVHDDGKLAACVWAESEDACKGAGRTGLGTALPMIHC